MAELKTKPTGASVRDFLERIEQEQKKQDAFVILELMREITGDEGKMWGDSIIGFGRYHYKYATGNEGDWFLVGFSPRKQNLTLYIMAGFDEYDNLMAKLGKYKIGKSCLYVKKLADIDQEVLKELIQQSVDHMVKTNPN